MQFSNSGVGGHWRLGAVRGGLGRLGAAQVRAGDDAGGPLGHYGRPRGLAKARERDGSSQGSGRHRRERPEQNHLARAGRHALVVPRENQGAHREPGGAQGDLPGRPRGRHPHGRRRGPDPRRPARPNRQPG